MLPSHEIDRNLPLRKFFIDLVNRAVEMSRSDAQMRRILTEFGDETGYDFQDASFRILANQVLFKTELTKHLAYGVLDLQHFVEYVEYIHAHPERARQQHLTENFDVQLKMVRNALAKLAPYADSVTMDTFDYDHVHTEPYGPSEPTAH